MANWEATLFDYDADDNLVYIGKSPIRNKATSDDGWYIIKFVWSDGAIVGQEKAIGSWDDREILGWR